MGTAFTGRLFRARVSGFALAIIGLALLSGCRPPADNTLAGSARLEVRMPEPGATTDASRAIAGTGGYLYVRALGGPDGDVGKFWGPLSVSGSSAIITDIEPGLYDGFFVLHASHDIGENTFSTWQTVSNPDGGGTVSLQALMEYADEVFRDYANPTDGKDSIFANPVTGRGSSALTGPVTIRPGINAFSLTLVPLTTSDTRRELINNNNGNYATTIYNQSPGFFRLAFPSEGPDWESTFFSMSAVDHVIPSFFYASSGKRISGVTFDSNDDTYRGTVATSAFPIYVYVGSYIGPTYFTAYEGGLPAAISVQNQTGETIQNGEEHRYDDVTYSSPTITADLTVSNSGTRPLVISSFAISGANSGNYYVSTGASLTIQPFEDKTVSVVFHYTPGAGPREATLTINSNSAVNGSFALSLRGAVADE